MSDKNRSPLVEDLTSFGAGLTAGRVSAKLAFRVTHSPAIAIATALVVGTATAAKVQDYFQDIGKPKR